MDLNEEQLAICNNILQMVESSDSSDSDGSHHRELITMDFISSSEEDEIKVHATVDDFIGTVGKYNDEDFKMHFRLHRNTAEYLIDRYSTSEFPPKAGHGRRARIGPPAEIYIFLWYISNTVTFREVGNLFGVAKSSAWISVRRVSAWLVSISHEFIKWPQGASSIEVAAKFEAKRRIPGIIGAIDCTHIKIKAPKENKTCYFDRNRKYSIVVQAVVDADKKFTDVFIGQPGSMHDSRVFRKSRIYDWAMQNPQEMFSGETFIIGDPAYASSSWLVAPFKNYGTLSESQIQFNNLHSSTRMVVENAFGLLKTRFRRLLHFTEQTDLHLVGNIVGSACVLHNLCIQFNDEIEEEESPAYHVVNTASSTRDDSPDRRQQLFEYLRSRQII